MKFYLVYFTSKFFNTLESDLSVSDIKDQIYSTYGVPTEHIKLYEVNKTQYESFISRHGGKIIEHVNGEVRLVEMQNSFSVVFLNGIPTEVLNNVKATLETLVGVES